MTDLDSQVIQGSRMDLEADIMDEVRRTGETVVVIDWYSASCHRYTSGSR